MISYSLTDLTGMRKNDERRMVIMTVEVRRHTMIISLLSLLATLVLSFPFVLMFGPWALIVLPFGIFAGNVLFAQRQRRGMQVYRYRTLLDSKRAARGFWISGSPFATPEFIMHMPAVVEVAHIDEQHASYRGYGVRRDPLFVRGTADPEYAGEHHTRLRDRHA